MTDTQKRIQKIKLAFKDSIVNLDESNISHIDALSTGCFTVDETIGVGGFPIGRIIELFGNEGGGKSSLALSTVATLQKNNGIAAYIDLEQTLNVEYAKKLGVNVNDLLIFQCATGDEALEITEKLIQKDNVNLVVIDSIASIVTRAELEKGIADANMAQTARLMSQALPRLTSAINSHNSCLICINQIREKLGVMYGNPETTPGGRALKFYASVRLEVRKTGSLKDSDNVIYGDIIKIKTVKNKVFPPYRTCVINHIWGKGFDDTEGIIKIAIDRQVIGNPKQGFYAIPTLEGCIEEMRGMENVVSLMRDNIKLFESITAKIKVLGDVKKEVGAESVKKEVE